jgi:hypothetical protein
MRALYQLLSLPLQIVIGIGNGIYNMGINTFVSIRSIFGKTTKLDAAKPEKRSRKERKATISALKEEMDIKKKR